MRYLMSLVLVCSFAYAEDQKTDAKILALLEMQELSIRDSDVAGKKIEEIKKSPKYPAIEAIADIEEQIANSAENIALITKIELVKIYQQNLLERTADIESRERLWRTGIFGVLGTVLATGIIAMATIWFVGRHDAELKRLQALELRAKLKKENLL